MEAPVADSKTVVETRWARVRRQWQRFIAGETVPNARALLPSIAVHAIVLVFLIVQLQRTAPLIVYVGKNQAAQKLAAATYVPPSARRSPLQINQKQSKKAVRKIQKHETDFSPGEPTGEALREQARVATKAIITNFKFKTIYGFSPFPEYHLAVQTSGQLPFISPESLPPHYEQYVTVEVTIDTHGRVADARVVSGLVDDKIQQTILAAIRDFKYQPATRAGVPIPSQCDIVVHVPT
jgi:periplasmic protein TonB